MISERTKAALAAARSPGVKLGGDRGARLTQKARRAGWEARMARRGIPTATGIGTWQAAQVSRRWRGCRWRLRYVSDVR
jgi:DNA invertase Pin-like site-specific DNA recombinase